MGRAGPREVKALPGLFLRTFGGRASNDPGPGRNRDGSADRAVGGRICGSVAARLRTRTGQGADHNRYLSVWKPVLQPVRPFLAEADTMDVSAFSGQAAARFHGAHVRQDPAGQGEYAPNAPGILQGRAVPANVPWFCRVHPRDTGYIPLRADLADRGGARPDGKGQGL